MEPLDLLGQCVLSNDGLGYAGVFSGGGVEKSPVAVSHLWVYAFVEVDAVGLGQHPCQALLSVRIVEKESIFLRTSIQTYQQATVSDGSLQCCVLDGWRFGQGIQAGTIETT